MGPPETRRNTIPGARRRTSGDLNPSLQHLRERRCWMACRRVAGITAEQRRQLWKLWRAGEPVTAIAEALKRPDTLVRRALDRTGGIAPRERYRAARVLSSSE